MIEHWINGSIGIWILLSPWLLGFADVSLAKWSCVLAGLILIIGNAWTLFSESPVVVGSGSSSSNNPSSKNQSKGL